MQRTCVEKSARAPTTRRPQTKDVAAVWSSYPIQWSVLNLFPHAPVYISASHGIRRGSTKVAAYPSPRRERIICQFGIDLNRKGVHDPDGQPSRSKEELKGIQVARSLEKSPVNKSRLIFLRSSRNCTRMYGVHRANRIRNEPRPKSKFLE